MYNISGEDLFYKWEALNMLAKSTFSIKGAHELKEMIKRDKERAAESQRRASARANLGAAMRTGTRTGTGVLGIGRFGAAAGTPAKMRSDAGTPVKKEPRRGAIAGPSKVKYEGPSTDELKRRACEFLLDSTYIPRVKKLQTVTCMKRCLKEASVSLKICCEVYLLFL
jgi:hypothetical protein